MSINKISVDFAEKYDRQSIDYGWYSPEILFGLSYEYIKSGQNLLDIGIGTGLSSELFHKAGLEIYGIDSSENMLKICASKNTTKELTKHDLQNLPLPYHNNSFIHITINGVFHLLKDLAPLLDETSRLMTDQGILSFTIEEENQNDPNGYEKSNIIGISEKTNKISGVKTFRHSSDYIEKLLIINHFSILKQMDFLAFKASPWDREKYFKAYIVRKDHIK